MAGLRRNLGILLLASIALTGAARMVSAANICGLSPSDWCRAPSGDPCGEHLDERSCRADPRCIGMRYRGESVVACQPDGRGFWTNCPAVGCVSRVSGDAQPHRSKD